LLRRHDDGFTRNLETTSLPESVLIRKLEGWGPLTSSHKEILDKVTAQSHVVDSHQDLIRQGERPTNVHLILEGLAYRYKILKSGRRQIFAYLVPGDFCDLHTFILKAMDHSVATISRCVVVEIPQNTVLDLTENHPRIARALLWATLVDEAVLREWIVNGRRPAREGLAHLLCELSVRLEAVGLVYDGGYDLKLTQADLGDTLGISFVHVSRVLKYLRQKGLVTVSERAVHIPNLAKLKAFAGFNPNYLHHRAG
jgi:CRP-like cAMP-binding protein